MKKVLILSATVLGLFLSFSAKAQVSAGAGLVYGTEIEDLGIQVRGMYDINESIRGSVDFIFYLIGEEGVNASEININGHYIFLNNDKVKAYGLAGLNSTRVAVKFLGQKVSESVTGLNLGGGAEFGISDNMSILGEAKYSIRDGGQLVIGAGAIFKF